MSERDVFRRLVSIYDLSNGEEEKGKQLEENVR